MAWSGCRPLADDGRRLPQHTALRRRARRQRVCGPRRRPAFTFGQPRARLTPRRSPLLPLPMTPQWHPARRAPRLPFRTFLLPARSAAGVHAHGEPPSPPACVGVGSGPSRWRWRRGRPGTSAPAYPAHASRLCCHRERRRRRGVGGGAAAAEGQLRRAVAEERGGKERRQRKRGGRGGCACPGLSDPATLRLPVPQFLTRKFEQPVGSLT